jgi:hypothetical protein
MRMRESNMVINEVKVANAQKRKINILKQSIVKNKQQREQEKQLNQMHKNNNSAYYRKNY